MNINKTLFIIGTLLMFTACMNNEGNLTFEPNQNEDLELVKLSADGVVDQQPANQAKEILSNYEEISRVRAVNHDSNLLIAVEIDHNERFNLDNIEREVRKKIKQNFSKMKVTVSTDQKLLLELRHLENAIAENRISEQALEKQMDKLIKLSKEET